jgi:hypothetical protein
MQVGLTEAARLTGKDASTITRACQAGRLSFNKDETGQRMFEMAELERVFGKLRSSEEQRPEGQGDETPAAVIEAIERAHLAEVSGLQREIRRLEDLVDVLKAQCGQWQGQASQITHLLTDQRAQAVKDTERTARLEEAIAARAMQPGIMEAVGKFVAGVQRSWKDRSAV